MTKKIWEFSCCNLSSIQGSLCKCLVLPIFHVCLQSGWGWRGCPRPPPVPTGRPTPMFDFFLTTPGEPVVVGSPPPSLLSHRLSQEAAADLPHTHTWDMIYLPLLS